MKLELIEIVNRLIGESTPIGDSFADDIRHENLKRMVSLADELILQIQQVATLKGSYEFSVDRSGQFAYTYLKGLKDSL